MATEETVQTVSELTSGIKGAVENRFPRVWVVGEVSNCSRASSGHIYLTLKDDNAQIRAVMWRSRAERLKFDIHDGLEIVVSGPVEVYAARGSYQLIIERAEPQGMGALELAFRQLQEKLAKEGLFDAERKRPLPQFPQRIVLITSPTSAAVRDLLQVLTRRWRAADILILPVAVQGNAAAKEIAAAFQVVPQIPGVDVVITGRGGGSLEDLWAFNEEIVARAIFNCPVPVVSAVGHEIDVSIADLVADRRALTPSEAGELVVPDQQAVMRFLQTTQERLRAALQQQTQHARQRLESISTRRPFVRPLEMVHDRTAVLDELSARLQRGMKHQLQTAQQIVATTAARVDAINPLKVLQRGYSVTRIISDADQQSDADQEETNRGKAVLAADLLEPGMRIETVFAKGRTISRVESSEPD